jgi:hypothetical protein
MTATRTDLGNDHYYLTISDRVGNRIGMIENHPDKRDPTQRCEGFVCWSPAHARPGKLWKVVSEEPLTLEPSIKCATCGSHGFVREGRWVE